MIIFIIIIIIINNHRWYSFHTQVKPLIIHIPVSLPLITANRILNKPLINKKSLNLDYINKVNNNDDNNNLKIDNTQLSI